MIDFGAFSDELQKIAFEEFKPFGSDNVGAQIRAQLPVVNRLPKDPSKAKVRLERALNAKDTPTILGYRNVVVPEKQMPDLKAMGFKPTRIATPLPGEKMFTISYRAGRLHAHKLGPAFFVHQDKKAPMSSKGSYLSVKALRHGLQEGIPSIIKRVKERDALAIGAET